MAGATAEIHSALLTARLMGDLGGQGHRDTRDRFLTLARFSAPGQEPPLADGRFGARKPRLRELTLGLISRWRQSDQVRLTRLPSGRLTWVASQRAPRRPLPKPITPRVVGKLGLVLIVLPCNTWRLHGSHFRH